MAEIFYIKKTLGMSTPELFFFEISVGSGVDRNNARDEMETI